MNKPLRRLAILAMILGLGDVVADEIKIPRRPATKLCVPTELIVSTPFDRPEAIVPKGKGKDAAGWRIGNGRWEVRDGVLHGDELKADHHAAGLTWHAPFTDVVVTAQFKLGAAEQIAFGCRDAIAPGHHLARVFIAPKSIWVQKMSGIAKTTKAEKLKEIPVAVDPETWHDVTIEISNDRYRACIDEEYVVEAQHERFRDPKGIVALIVKGEGAQFRNIAVWNATPAP